ncbi:MAG: nitroreductase/dihydropteridine reductase [Candidatus Paceibacteria bacterium]|jgi:nitroreductase
MSLLHKLEWRYATKKFDSEKKVPEEEVTELLKAMNLTASSYGLQPFEFVVVKNQDIQDQLLPVSWNQSQLSDASHVIVIAAKTNMTADYIQDYIQRIADVRKVNLEDLEGYKQMMIGGPGTWSEDQVILWSQKQCYTVLGTLLLAAADLKIDACPMEGFQPDAYDEILGLKEQGLHATLVIPIGYRSAEDSTQHDAKSRRHLDDIIELRYSE